jgi:DNA-binding response OmpR family regulator
MVFSAEKIYESLWQEESFDSENTVMVHIRKIREKIEVNPRNPQYIKTVWGVGYKIEK